MWPLYEIVNSNDNLCFLLIYFAFYFCLNCGFVLRAGTVCLHYSGHKFLLQSFVLQLSMIIQSTAEPAQFCGQTCGAPPLVWDLPMRKRCCRSSLSGPSKDGCCVCMMSYRYCHCHTYGTIALTDLYFTCLHQ